MKRFTLAMYHGIISKRRRRRETAVKKRVLCIILACALLVGVIATGLIAYAPSGDGGATGERQVSDYFYMQIYNGEDQAVSRYKVTLTGTVSGRSREITAVSFICESGDICQTEYELDGDTAYVIITHPTEGYLLRGFILDANGNFSGF